MMGWQYEESTYNDMQSQIESLHQTIATLNEALATTSAGNFKLREQLADASTIAADDDSWEDAYKAMLYAAPTPPTDTDELREAARAVVEWWHLKANDADEELLFDRLRKAL
jgi:hypothetical protein